MRIERKMAREILQAIPEYTNNFGVGGCVLKAIEEAIVKIIRKGIEEDSKKNKAL